MLLLEGFDFLPKLGIFTFQDSKPGGKTLFVNVASAWSIRVWAFYGPVS